MRKVRIKAALLSGVRPALIDWSLRSYVKLITYTKFVQILFSPIIQIPKQRVGGEGLNEAICAIDFQPKFQIHLHSQGV